MATSNHSRAKQRELVRRRHADGGDEEAAGKTSALENMALRGPTRSPPAERRGESQRKTMEIRTPRRSADFSRSAPNLYADKGEREVRT